MMEDRRFDISVVICTFDRPTELGRLLAALATQRTSLRFEVIVVENHPGPGWSPPSEGARWIQEPREGLSYARNTGVQAASAPVVVFVDDDMEPAEAWLESLATPLLEDGYDAVTGPTVPIKLETVAERLFEAYGGHGHGSIRRVYNAAWLAAQRLKLPLWEVGGLGNAAIRRSVFERVGLFEEALGAGTAAGSWEDLDLIYRMLLAGCRILHEPAAAVRHAHREDLVGLARQLCGYRRGEVCFCLLILLRRGEWRAIPHLAIWIPYWRAKLFALEVLRRMRGNRLMSFGLMGRELLAYASGPRALAASVRRRRAIEHANDGPRNR